jgi:hypothetical protein
MYKRIPGCQTCEKPRYEPILYLYLSGLAITSDLPKSREQRGSTYSSLRVNSASPA